ncbi:hypothetical protein ABGB18_13110 [Nonomuraea sp. B12E4]|uniref:hypothetical protein n=1 Tax=Nonomuraea sp. B12E4 TaxID=3153564 RepID=UPI00325F5ED2
MGEWKELLHEMETLLRVDHEPASSLSARIRELNGEAAVITAASPLVGSVFIQARCNDVWSFYESDYKGMLLGEPALSAEDWAKDLYGQAYHTLLDNIRDDLGTPPRALEHVQRDHAMDATEPSTARRKA